MPTRTAICSCRQLQVTTRGESVRISVCHCLACQQRTGSIFGAQARFPRDRVDFNGHSKTYTRIADSGHKITFHFCPECGATVYYFLNDMPDIIAVPIGAFADSTFPKPTVEVYEERRHSWAKLEIGSDTSD